ncbi:MAG: hypothetical protein QXS41_00195 [Candidatus Woesearchaeota archaeon]
MHDNTIKEELKSLFREKFEKIGKNKILGDIFVECLFSPTELSLNELSSLTGYSISSLSLALKQKDKMFNIINKPGDKKTYVDINFKSEECMISELKELNNFILPTIINLMSKIQNKNQKQKTFEKNIQKMKKIIEKIIEEFENEN